MIAALLCALLGAALAMALQPPWTLVALLPLGFGLWLWAGAGERWMARRSRRRGGAS